MGRWTVVPVCTTMPVVRESGLRRAVGSTERARAAVASLGPRRTKNREVTDRGSLVTALIYIGHRGEILEVGNTVT